MQKAYRWNKSADWKQLAHENPLVPVSLSFSRERNPWERKRQILACYASQKRTHRTSSHTHCI